MTGLAMNSFSKVPVSHLGNPRIAKIGSCGVFSGVDRPVPVGDADEWLLNPPGKATHGGS